MNFRFSISVQISLTFSSNKSLQKHIYNILQPNDKLQASTVRNVKTETSTGSVSTKREHFKIKIKVESTFFDETVCCLSAKGRNVEENRFVKMGQYHTIDLALNEKFTLEKDHWDSVTISRINEACDIQVLFQSSLFVLFRKKKDLENAYRVKPKLVQ